MLVKPLAGHSGHTAEEGPCKTVKAIQEGEGVGEGHPDDVTSS